MTETRIIRSSENPELANKIAQQIMEGGSPEFEEDPQQDLIVPDLAATRPTQPGLIQLPGGYVDTETGEVLTTAEVEELTGFAEEALAKPGSPSKRFEIVLKHGLSKVGDGDPTVKTLDRLLVGDRVAIILAIRQLTYGDTIVRKWCESCEEVRDFAINLMTDPEVRELGDRPRAFSVELSRGTAHMVLPDGAVHNEVLNKAPDLSQAEITTLILRSVVNDINGMPVTGPDAIRRLSARDRRALMQALDEHDFGPNINDIKKACPECGEVSHLSLNLGDLF